MQQGLLYLPITTHEFIVSAILDTGATRSFVSSKLAEKLLVTVKDTTPIAVA